MKPLTIKFRSDGERHSNQVGYSEGQVQSLKSVDPDLAAKLARA